MITKDQIYRKARRGSLSWDERQMIDSIYEHVSQLPKDKQGSFQPATTKEELKALHEQYSGQYVDYEETKSAATGASKSTSSSSNTVDDEEIDLSDDNAAENVSNPMTETNPRVRDYVTENQGTGQANSANMGGGNGFRNFDEPLSFSESFELPNDDKSDKDQKSNAFNGGANKEQNSSGGSNTFNKIENKEEAKKKKQVRKFAEVIVDTTNQLQAIGYIWWITKDISEQRLEELHVANEINLDVLIHLDGAEKPVREFFAKQRQIAVETAPIDKETKEELVDALTEYLIEQNYTPTPLQNLIVCCVKMVGLQTIKAMQQRAISNSVLDQLKNMTGAMPANAHVSNSETSDEHKEESAEEHAENEPETKAAANIKNIPEEDATVDQSGLSDTELLLSDQG